MIYVLGFSSEKVQKVQVGLYWGPLPGPVSLPLSTLVLSDPVSSIPGTPVFNKYEAVPLMPQNGLCCGFLYGCEHHNVASSEESNLPFERNSWLSSSITWTSSRTAAVQYSGVHEADFW